MAGLVQVIDVDCLFFLNSHNKKYLLTTDHCLIVFITEVIEKVYQDRTVLIDQCYIPRNQKWSRRDQKKTGVKRLGART
jgi:hypothetical protein